MQQTSLIRQWLVGHGIDSFEDDFKAFSRFHELGFDFNAPHNFVLELLYTVGLVGLMAVVVMLGYCLYARLFQTYATQKRAHHVAALIAVLTANLLFASITIGFFTSYNLPILSVIVGLALALADESNGDSGQRMLP